MSIDLLTDEGLAEYINSIDERLLQFPEGRRKVTKYDPLAFALLYLSKHLRSSQTGGKVTFSDLHVQLIEDAKMWALPPLGPRAHRDAYIAPRESGKSTWLFLILPLWAAAHGHVKFIAAFAHTAMQAQTHLTTFKNELENNDLLRQDFPELCTPSIRIRGVTVGDTQREYRSASGFTFMARGIDNGVLGMKVDEFRPDLIIGDDVEPDESSYSAYKMQKRLTTFLDAILPLNEFARVILTGTVTMPGSIIHQLVRSVQNPADTEQWIKDANFRVHYCAPIVVDLLTGAERSIWPAKWTLEYLNSIRHGRDYKKNFANDPMGLDGDLWRDTTFIYRRIECVRYLLSIDPAMTTRRTSDPTGLAIIGYRPPERTPDGVIPSLCSVEYAAEARKVGADLRNEVLQLLTLYPQIGRVLVESNQGGDHWGAILHNLPVGLETKANTIKKEVRAAKVHNYYERRRVFHAKKLNAAEEQMVAFPKAPHDDMVDAIGTGILYFFEPDLKKKARTESIAYV